MSISLKKVSKSYNSTVVLNDVTIAFNVPEKIVLVGENGSGKTTILKICVGIEEASTGKVFFDEYSRTCYVPQEFPVEDYPGMTGFDYVYTNGTDSLLRGVRRLLAEFELDESVLELPLESLSGGQQKILSLSVAIAQRPQYLLIDEPENHLDIFARQTLISILKEYKACVVFVSHDQELINSVTNRIVEVQDGTLNSYTGSYEFYLEHKARMEEGKAHTWKTHKKKVDQLDKLIKRMREWVNKNPDLGAQLSARKTQLRQLQEKAPDRPKAQKRSKMSIVEVEKGSKRMLLAEKLTIQLGGLNIIEDTDLVLVSGEKVALIGRNGSGKSTFLKSVIGKVPIHSGKLKVADNVRVGYFSQDSLATLDLEKTPLEVVSCVALGVPEHAQRALLARYLIGTDICMRKIKTLSGGQKTRLRFCLLFAAKNDFLILDEPTNHLDPVTWEILVEVLKEYQGTLLMVSHDRMFIDQIDPRLWIVDNHEIYEHFGTINEYLMQ